MCQKVLLFRCLQQSELQSLSFKVLLGCYASRNCQTENKTRFILKEILFWLQGKKKTLDSQAVKGPGAKHGFVCTETLMTFSFYLEAYQRITTNSSKFVALS